MDTKVYGFKTRFRKAAAFVVGAAGVVLTDLASAGTNAAHRQALLRDEPRFYAVARSGRAARLGYVPTNSVAFREWAMSLMLTQANLINDRWQLGLSTALTSDHLTAFSATAKTSGPDGAIRVESRFVFSFSDGRWNGFRDEEYCWSKIEANLARLEALRTQRSLLTKEAATQVAAQALRALDLDRRQIDTLLPPAVSQLEFESKDGRMYSLPLYRIEWRRKLDKAFVPISMEVSGLAKRVVSYINYLAEPMPLPSHYYQMLGISPRRNEWGKQFGYDPLDTDEFRDHARRAAVEQLNHLINAWSLVSGGVSTNDITAFQATPRTNGFDIAIAQFGSRFYLQTVEGRLQLFKDTEHNLEAMTDRVVAASRMTNALTLTRAEQLARDALRRLGFTERQLQLREPPVVKQWALTADGSDDGPVYKLPLYDVQWVFPAKEQAIYGDGAAAVAFQISGVTGKVVMYANNSPLTPRQPLPKNYLEIIGVSVPTNSISVSTNAAKESLRRPNESGGLPGAFGPATNVFRGPDLQTLQNADSIRAFRLDPSVDRSTNKHPKFGGYPVLKESSLTNATFAKAVVAALLAEEKFTPSGTRKCSFEPVVGFLISKGTNYLEALICFQCSEVAIRSSSGQGGYFLHFNTSAPRLLALAKQAFPGDRVFDATQPPASRFE